MRDEMTGSEFHASPRINRTLSVKKATSNEQRRNISVSAETTTTTTTPQRLVSVCALRSSIPLYSTESPTRRPIKCLAALALNSIESCTERLMVSAAARRTPPRYSYGGAEPQRYLRRSVEGTSRLEVGLLSGTRLIRPCNRWSPLS